MPGASRVSMYAVPSPSGSCAICLASTVMPLMPVVVLRSRGFGRAPTTLRHAGRASSDESTFTASPTATCGPRFHDLLESLTGSR